MLLPKNDDSGLNAQSLFATLQDIVRNMDINGSGSIECEEFHPIYMRLNPLGSQDDADRKFHEIDTDNDATISIVELAEHYGFRFASDGDVDGDVDTNSMRDDQLIELLQLSSIATDCAKERQQEMEAEARAAKLDNQRKLVSMSSVRRLELNRRTSTMLDLPISPGVRHARRAPGFAKRQHATTQELEFLDSCALGDHKAIEQAILKGIDPCVSDEKGECGLHKVARLEASRTAVQAASLLLEKGVNINYQDRNGKTSAHYAAEYGHVDMLAWLFANGADSSLVAIDGWTVLHEAAFKSSVSCVGFLLKLPDRPDINARDTLGRTALHIAAYRCTDAEIPRLLVEHGADMSVKDTQQYVAKDLAMRAGRDEVSAFFSSQTPPS